jgi:hypothetical protein
MLFTKRIIDTGRTISCGPSESGIEMDQKKILIVEDNELNMKLFHDLLEVHG